MSIEVQALSKTYGSQEVLKAISFTAKPGRVTGFLGPNGAGKSTTMKCLAGLLVPDTGILKVNGLDVATQSLEVKRCLGYLPEQNPLYLDLYVKEALSFMANVYQISPKEARIAEVIELTGLGPEQHKRIGQLSKGYQQRVGLAQAILHKPAVLILDEPTSGLDPNQVLGIRDLIKAIGKTTTVLISTHILQEVAAICDDVIILSKGHLVANSSLPDLLAAYPSKTLEQIFQELTA
ncbi:MAG: ATP-binding cassette domain-containing protein [Sphingobacteriaceae bacterium]